MSKNSREHVWQFSAQNGAQFFKWSIAMKTLLWLRLLALSFPAGAASKQGFACDVINASCTCKGSKVGADCKAMKKNCDDTGMVCSLDPSGRPMGCACTMALGVKLKGKVKAPMDTTAPVNAIQQ